MIEQLLDLLSGRREPELQRQDDIRLSVAALLVEAARMDSVFGADERCTIETLLAEKFHLEPQAVDALVEDAQRKMACSTQYFPFTHEICTRFSREERVEVIEMLWTVAYADGVLDPEEDMLIRQIAGLIHVPDRERMLARQRALAKLAASKPTN